MLTPEQLEFRMSGIGGSDSAAVIGVSPYTSARALYHEKVGDIEPDDLSDNDAVHFGNVLEDIVAQEYMRRTGRKVRRKNASLRHPDLPFIIGHIDRDVVGLPRALECKTSDAMAFNFGDWGPEGTDEVPEHYFTQAQHYMGLLPKVDVFDLAVLVGGNRFRLYHIHRDDTFIRDLFDADAAFWRDHVEKKTPPPIDPDHSKTLKLLADLYPGTTGEVIQLDEAAAHWKAVMDEAKGKVKLYEGVANGAKAHLLDLIGDGSVGLLPDGTGYTRKFVERKAYTCEATKYLDFRFSKSPKGVQK